MPKEYFTHDYNARNDPKCVALIKDFGMTGYGVFWCLVEIMNEQGGRIKKFPSLFSALAHDLKIRENALTKQIEAMLHKYHLLVEDEKYIWSESVLGRLSEREDKKKKRIEAGRLGGVNSGKSRTNAKQTKQNEANEANKRKGKEIKGKEKKERGIYPTKDFQIELSDLNIGQAVEYLFNTKKIAASREMILSLWTVFKTKNFTGKKFYKDEADIISHFFNSLKYENISNGSHINGLKPNAKTAGANSLLRRGTEEFNRGGE